MYAFSCKLNGPSVCSLKNRTGKIACTAERGFLAGEPHKAARRRRRGRSIGRRYLRVSSRSFRSIDPTPYSRHVCKNLAVGVRPTSVNIAADGFGPPTMSHEVWSTV